MATKSNLFSKLAKWAHRQDENFVTESFVCVIQHLLDKEPVIGRQLVAWLCFGDDNPQRLGRDLPRVRTQVTTDEGRPDIQIETDKLFALIEVKKNSDPGPTQIKRYLEIVRKKSVGRDGRFVFLSLRPAGFDLADPTPHRCVQWSHVEGWLSRRPAAREDSRYLITQFVDFLKDEIMAIEQVEWDYIRGMRNFRRLTAMLSKAIEDVGIPRGQRSVRVDFNGWYIEGKNYWVGIDYDAPEKLRFGFWDAKPDNAKLKELETEELPDGSRAFILNLDSEAVHFFACEKERQLAVLANFIKEAYRMAKLCVPPADAADPAKP